MYWPNLSIAATFYQKWDFKNQRLFGEKLLGGAISNFLAFIPVLPMTIAAIISALPITFLFMKKHRT